MNDAVVGGAPRHKSLARIVLLSESPITPLNFRYVFYTLSLRGAVRTTLNPIFKFSTFLFRTFIVRTILVAPL